MKRLALALLMIMALGAGMSFAAGGKNKIRHHGEVGKGSTHTGSQASGTAKQDRAGR